MVGVVYGGGGAGRVVDRVGSYLIYAESKGRVPLPDPVPKSP